MRFGDRQYLKGTSIQIRCICTPVDNLCIDQYRFEHGDEVELQGDQFKDAIRKGKVYPLDVHLLPIPLQNFIKNIKTDNVKNLKPEAVMEKGTSNVVMPTQENKIDKDRECLKKICDEGFTLLSGCGRFKRIVESTTVENVSARKFLSRVKDRAARLQSELMRHYLELSDATLVSDLSDLEIIIHDDNN